MEDKIKEKIIEAGLLVIQEENLPVPTRIWLRTTLKGTIRAKGKCIKRRTAEIYRLVVNTTDAKFFEDSKGKYIDKTTKKRFRLAGIGVERKHTTIINDLAHEIAHMKFWDHSASHRNYTKYLNQKLITILKDNPDIEINIH